MRLLRKSRSVLMVLVGIWMLACSSPAKGQNSFQAGKISLWTGYWQSRADASWQKSFTCQAGHCISKLAYHNLDAGLYSLEIDAVPRTPFFSLHFHFAVASINSGDSQDSDYENQVLTNRTENAVDGRVDLWSLEGQLLLSPRSPVRLKSQRPRRSRPWQWHGIFGIQRYQDSLRIFGGKIIQEPDPNQAQALPSNAEPFWGWLDSHYTFTWDAIKSGLKFTWDLSESRDFSPWCYSLHIKGKAALLLARYQGQGIWNGKSNFAQDPSFRHKAYGYGLEAGLSILYHPWPLIGLELGWHYLHLAVDDGTETLYLSSGEVQKIQLDEVRLLRQGWSIRATLSF